MGVSTRTSNSFGDIRELDIFRNAWCVYKLEFSDG